MLAWSRRTQRGYPSTRTLLVAADLAKFAKYCRIPAFVTGPDKREKANYPLLERTHSASFKRLRKCVHGVSGRKGAGQLPAGPGLAKSARFVEAHALVIA